MYGVCKKPHLEIHYIQRANVVTPVDISVSLEHSIKLCTFYSFLFYVLKYIPGLTLQMTLKCLKCRKPSHFISLL